MSHLDGENTELVNVTCSIFVLTKNHLEFLVKQLGKPCGLL
jgi:hypothetical protein